MSSEKPGPRGPRPPRVPPERPGPVGGKRDANRRRRTQQLCDAGLELFLEAGVMAVTIDDIARRAGLAKGSFYRYFANKAELVETLLGLVGEPVEAALDACERALRAARSPDELLAAYQALGVDLASAVVRAPRVVQLYLQEARAPGIDAREPIRALAERIDARALALTAAAREHGLLRPFDARLSSLAVVGAAERLLLAVLRGEDTPPAATIPGALASLVLDGLRAQRDG